MLLFLGSVAAYAVDSRLASVRHIFIIIMRYAFIVTAALLVTLACVLIPVFNDNATKIIPGRPSIKPYVGVELPEVAEAEESTQALNGLVPVSSMTKSSYIA
jgi:hypothetical protein